MQAWLQSTLALLALPEYGLSTLFVAAFVSATLLPVGSEPALFGLDYNPLSHFRRPPTLVEDGQRSIRFRRTCCFYYLATEPAEYCSTCPLLRPGKCR